MVYPFRLFEKSFFRGFPFFYRMFVVPPPERYDHIIFTCVGNFAGDPRRGAIGTDF